MTTRTATPPERSMPATASNRSEGDVVDGEDVAGSTESAPPAQTDCDAMFVDEVDCEGVAGFDRHEKVIYCTDPDSGLRAFVALHSTRLGPALGGCRMWKYASESEALQDVLRLSQGMSYKHAVAGTRQGGGKAVILGDPRTQKHPALFQAFGRLVHRLGGKYITAEDVGTSVPDMVLVQSQTPYVAGLPEERGGSGDPSPVTAYGVYCGIQACVAYRDGRAYDPQASLKGITVAVQGTGHVGSALCGYLHQAGARLVVADVNAVNVQEVVRNTEAVVVAPEEIHQVAADVFAPCALGGGLKPQTLDELAASIVAGAANNQLSSPSVGDQLWQRGILYAPDYVINAGGIINISYESQGYDRPTALRHSEQIGVTLTEIFAEADRTQTPPHLVADARALAALRQPV